MLSKNVLSPLDNVTALPMAPPLNVKVVHYDTNHVANPYPEGELPWQVYHTVRNAVFQACRRHGPTGAMGECPISYDQNIDDPYGMEGWQIGDDPCEYFIVDDQYNHEQYLYMEIYATERLSLSWLADVIATLRNYPGWGIGVTNIDKGFLLIFSDKIMVHGPVFARCRSVDSVLKAARRNFGGTRERNTRQVAKQKWRNALDIRSPWACAGIGIVVAILFGVVSIPMGNLRPATVITALAGAIVGLALWAYTHGKAKRRRIVGSWACEIDGQERCIDLQQDEMADVTRHGYVTSMDYSVDWHSRPPTLTLRYLGLPAHDESHQPLEPFDVHEAGKSVSTWTTTYAFRFLSDNELQLAPPGTDFSAPSSANYPVYQRRLRSGT